MRIVFLILLASSHSLFFFFFKGVFATVFDPSQKKKHKGSKFDPEGNWFATVCKSIMFNMVYFAITVLNTVSFCCQALSKISETRITFPIPLRITTERKDLGELLQGQGQA